MTLLDKWNYDSDTYEPYEIPDSWNVATFSRDMEKLIDCCQCGLTIKYGDAYTSKEVHTHIGIGYMVCEDCYREERARELTTRA